MAYLSPAARNEHTAQLEEAGIRALSCQMNRLALALGTRMPNAHGLQVHQTLCSPSKPVSVGMQLFVTMGQRRSLAKRREPQRSRVRRGTGNRAAHSVHL